MDATLPAPAPTPATPADAEALLDAWMDAWCELTAPIHRFHAEPEAITKNWFKHPYAAPLLAAFQEAVRVSDALDGTPAVLALQAGLAEMDLRIPEGRSLFAKHWLGLYARTHCRIFDRDWLAGLLQARDQWLILGPTFVWPEDGWPPLDRLNAVSLDRLNAVSLGPSESLTDVVRALKATKPGRTWAKRAAQLAADDQGAAIRAALIDWLRLLAVRGPASERRRLWPEASRYHGFRAHVLASTAVAGTPAKAALLHIFQRRGPHMVFPGRSSQFDSFIADPAVLTDAIEVIARGAVWLLSEWRDREVIATLRDTATTLLARLQILGAYSGYRSLKVANACLSALGRIATTEAVAALAAVRLSVRDKALAKTIAAALEDTAARVGMSVEELEELSVPTYDLDGVGERAARVGDYRLTLSVLTTTRAKITVETATGKALKSVPAALKRDEDGKAALKSFKESEKGIAKMLPAVRRRIEASYLSGKTWPAPIWRERFLDHPVTGTLARRLIWSITEPGAPARSALWVDGRLVDGGLVDGTGAPVPLPDAAQIALWHPLTAAEGEAAAWRSLLLDTRIVQPFKQAHRELYPLTEAERTTATYSNRFAGHILRQHQSVTLARARDWSATLRIAADMPNDEPTHLRLPAVGLAAEFWTESTGDDEFSDSGAYTYLKTDRVRFRRLAPEGGDRFGLGEAVPLEAVPPLLFSEVMRDVDLFVGVASIGHDPMWIDGGADAEHPTQWGHAWRQEAELYWHRQANAELSVSAQSRKAFFQQILPGLAIADRCTIEDRHLRVQGQLQAYRIHFGSGNILMEDGRYLCIVAARAGKDGPAVFLPFEGDQMISVILSKAFLLADDHKIKDPSIRGQLGRH